MGYAIAAGHAKTLEAAKVILEAGGNSFDAAIASAFTMFITEPCMASAGAGGFAMCSSEGKSPLLLDFFTQTPSQKNKNQSLDFYPIEVNFGNEQEIFYLGRASIAVPGMIKGIFEIHRRYGSLPIEELLAFPKELAKSGVIIDTFQEIDLELLGPIFWQDEGIRKSFFKDQKKTLKEGDLLFLPNFHNFLEMMEYEGDSIFYYGELSKRISDDVLTNGGFLQRSDLENYSTFWRKPIKYSYKNADVYLPNAPSLGGALCGLLLNEIQRGKSWIETVIGVREEHSKLKTIYPRFLDILPECGLQMVPGSPSTKGTSHFSIIDKDKNVISFSCSIGEGSGYFIPETDMQMNNMLGELFLLPEGPHSWETSTRLHSMMTPVIVNGDNGLFAGGSGGAGRIPYMVGQVIDNWIKRELEEAVQLPRCYAMNGKVHVEQGFEISSFPKEYSIKQWDYKSLFFGGVHSVAINKKGIYEASGDLRRYGHSFVSS